MIWIWAGVVVVLILVEIMSRNSTAGCFAVSGIISCILTFLTNNYIIQLSEFLIVGILLIIFARPYVLRWLNQSQIKVKKKKT